MFCTFIGLLGLFKIAAQSPLRSEIGQNRSAWTQTLSAAGAGALPLCWVSRGQPGPFIQQLQKELPAEDYRRTPEWEKKRSGGG